MWPRASVPSQPLVKFANAVTGGRIAIPIEQGATPLVHLATAENLDVPSGTYFDGLKPFGRIDGSGKKPGVAAALWQESARRVSLAD